MTRTFSDGHPKVLPACKFLSQYYFYNILLQKSCRFSLQTLTKFQAAKTGSGVGFLRLTAVCHYRNYIFDIAQPWLGQLTAVKTSYPLTSIAWGVRAFWSWQSPRLSSGLRLDRGFKRGNYAGGNTAGAPTKEKLLRELTLGALCPFLPR